MLWNRYIVLITCASAACASNSIALDENEQDRKHLLPEHTSIHVGTKVLKLSIRNRRVVLVDEKEWPLITFEQNESIRKVVSSPEGDVVLIHTTSLLATSTGMASYNYKRLVLVYRYAGQWRVGSFFERDNPVLASRRAWISEIWSVTNDGRHVDADIGVMPMEVGQNVIYARFRLQLKDEAGEKKEDILEPVAVK